jgi:hypothetical protein
MAAAAPAANCDRKLRRSIAPLVSGEIFIIDGLNNRFAEFQNQDSKFEN